MRGVSIAASLAVELLRRLVPALLDHAEALGHQLGQRRIAGHLSDLLLPEIEIAGGEALEIRSVGHGGTIDAIRSPSEAATSATTEAQSPGSVWRNRRAEGYQGDSARSRSQRQQPS